MEKAARFYTGIVPNSRIVSVARYSEVGHDIHGQAPGSVVTVEFELGGQPFTALNGGPRFTFSEAISFQVSCETQAEVHHFRDRLSHVEIRLLSDAGGSRTASACPGR